jgi:hypothetical protein
MQIIRKVSFAVLGKALECGLLGTNSKGKIPLFVHSAKRLPIPKETF